MTSTSIIETSAGALYEGIIDLEAVRRAHTPFSLERTTHYADGNMAAAFACLQMWRLALYAGFPITPSTKWLETVAAVVGNGRVGKKRVKLLEAEHAVADYMAGAAAACRDLIVATATSSVGLDHMTESTRSLGASGLGNVLLIDVYRATANYPLCIEGDPSDTLAHRDDGFIQICCRGVQQIYDTVIQAPCLGMHPEIMTPTMPGYYGIKDSHRSSRLLVEADTAIHAFQDRWCQASRLPGLINGDTAMGNCVTSQYFQGFKINQRARMERTFDILPQIGSDFRKTFDRPGIELVEKVSWPDDNDVDLAIIAMGPDVGTAAAIAIEEEARWGLRIGILAVRLLTPFPRDEYARLLKRVKRVLIVNQAHHAGIGHVSLDITNACYGLNPQPILTHAFAGLGGACVSDETWKALIAKAATTTTHDGTTPLYVHDGKVVWPS